MLILVGFTLFALVVYGDTDFSASGPAEWASPGSLLSGGMLIFVAYEGFELIANSAPDVRNRGVPSLRAYLISVLTTMVLSTCSSPWWSSVAVARGDRGRAEDFALRRPPRSWGRVGFDLIVFAALLSTASAINATLFGTARLTVELAIDGEVPRRSSGRWPAGR
ncbi:MAG: amino acid permease [Acidimicrobiales bacterium]